MMLKLPLLQMLAAFAFAILFPTLLMRVIRPRAVPAKELAIQTWLILFGLSLFGAFMFLFFIRA